MSQTDRGGQASSPGQETHESLIENTTPERRPVRPLYHRALRKNMKKLIEFKNIVKEFDGQLVLKGINLDINENEFVTLLGPSGCG